MIDAQKILTYWTQHKLKNIADRGPTEKQKTFSEFVQKLKEHGIKGGEYRRRVTEWFKNNP